ncbi:MAG TPA: glycoside hydrolase family 3 N-terminal domain-containing protein [Spirochaetia bacterium]|nr:glycoside hydrolase family 3 N-terminal domain-containing protein [Spirochaetia bacterium]
MRVTASARFLLATVLLVAAAGALSAQSSFVDSLQSQGRLRIPLSQAREIQDAVGQLLVVNVDGFGYSGPLALEPAFAPMVQRLEIGAVIPHYGSTSFERIRSTNRALAALTKAPLMVCSDIVRLSGAGRVASFGDGYVGGFLGRYRGLPDDQLATLARLNAFVFTALGINVSLGPTVDSSTDDPRTTDRARIVVEALKEYGLQAVLKHFPFLPASANLHKESPDTKLPLAQARQKFGVFSDLSGQADVVMTTHLYDSSVDAALVTFSPTWNGILRDETGYPGLLMTDGLLMLRNYADRRPLAGGVPAGDFAGSDSTAAWAARAILAGHDLVIVEGSPYQTVRVWEGLLAAACGGSSADAELRRRILASASRIARWKSEREAELRRTVDASPADVAAVIRLLPADGADPGAFHFDSDGLERLRPVLEAAAVSR